MQFPDDPAARILEIESRQDEALHMLAELEIRIEQALAESLVVAGRIGTPDLDRLGQLRAA